MPEATQAATSSLEIPHDFDRWNAEEKAAYQLLAAGKTAVANMRSGKMSHLIAWANSRNLCERVDRLSQWGNPFVIGRDGDRAQVIRKHAESLLKKPSLLRQIGTLKGKLLLCWCHPQPCHGHLLQRLADQA